MLFWYRREKKIKINRNVKIAKKRKKKELVTGESNTQSYASAKSKGN